MCFPRKTTVNLVKCATSAHMMGIVQLHSHDVYTPLLVLNGVGDNQENINC